jgi:hypothetical protein
MVFLSVVFLLLRATLSYTYKTHMLCLRPEDAFFITCVANLMEVKVLYVQQDLQY